MKGKIAKLVFEPDRVAPENIMELSVDYLTMDDATLEEIRQVGVMEDKARFDHNNCVLWGKQY